ncbi:LacI family DNA-binding transcriptional regulator [Coraliomargarita parva]|uniref:LacI family DNA-binding transcriptional regulator n=1 Tax=Coraliomargarita parva TaxID=3014050 RepID=UPI0022B55919|nr:LacI family DNA-binding transcriptional regulator [Coraliomargarita parva]
MSRSIKDVARLAGCSISTVSRVLSGNGYISEESRRKVEAAAKQLNYRPNRVARSLRARRSTVIGLLVSDIRMPFFAEVSSSIERTAMANGYTVLICSTEEDERKEALYLELMQEEQVAGIVFSPTCWKNKSIDFSALPPVVCVDRKMADVKLDSVLVDNADSSKRLAECLVEGGYRRVAGIFGGSNSYTTSTRVEGFKAAFAGNPSLLAKVYQSAPTEEAGAKLVRQALEEDPEVDAFFCGNALIASGAYRELRLGGRRKPSEFGFVSFDDPSWASFVEPAVTVIRQPAALIGEAATDLLLKRIEDPERQVSEMILRGELIVRESALGPR